jgi:hypothetical protein
MINDVPKRAQFLTQYIEKKRIHKNTIKLSLYLLFCKVYNKILIFINFNNFL